MDPKRKEERRAFNEALRARLRMVAAARAVPDAEMKWTGRLRHQDMVEFVEKHRLVWAWVLCGEGSPPAFVRWTPRIIQGGRQ
jgi:hypothetical protein